MCQLPLPEPIAACVTTLAARVDARQAGDKGDADISPRVIKGTRTFVRVKNVEKVRVPW